MKILYTALVSLVTTVMTGTVLGQDAPKLPADAALRPKIIGTWTSDSQGEDGKKSSKNVLRLTEQGDFSRQITLSLGPKPMTVTGSGKWELKGGQLVLTTLSKISPQGQVKAMDKPAVTQSKILSISDHEFVIGGMDPKSPIVYKR